MKKTDIGLKILAAIREKGWDQRRLARETGILESTLSHYIANKTYPRIDILIRIADALDKPVAYFIDENETVTGRPRIALPLQRRIPVFDSSCGELINWNDGTYPPGDYPLTEPADSKDGKAFFLKAHGNALTGRADERRVIFDGDLLLVEPGKKIQSGDLVLCREGEGEVVLRRFIRLPDKKVILLPLDERGRPSVLSSEDNPGCFKVTRLHRKF